MALVFTRLVLKHGLISRYIWLIKGTRTFICAIGMLIEVILNLIHPNSSQQLLNKKKKKNLRNAFY